MLPFDSLPLDTLLDPKEFAAETGRVLRGISLTSKPDGWQIVIRCWSKAHGPQYAMWTSQTDLVASLRSILDVLGTRAGPDLWRKDKFA